MIRALIFDCFGVVYSETIDQLYNLAGEDNRDELHDLIVAVDRAHISNAEFLERVQQLTGLSREVLRHTIEDTHVRNEPLIERLKELRRNYKIGMLTNVNQETLDTIFPPQERQELFDEVVISGVEKIVKPDPEIYKIIASRLGLTCEECLFVDDRQQNIDGAYAVGMQAILFRNNQQLEQDMAGYLKAPNA